MAACITDNMKATEKDIYTLLEMIKEIKDETVRCQLFSVACHLRNAEKILQDYEKEIFIRNNLSKQSETGE